MADMKKDYDDLIIINLFNVYLGKKISSKELLLIEELYGPKFANLNSAIAIEIA